MKHLFFVLFLLTLSFSAPVSADQIISEQTLRQFLASMGEVKKESEVMDPKSKDQLSQSTMASFNAGNFAPYTYSTSVLRKSHPQDFQKLQRITTAHGFKDVTNWATTGDDLVAAYMSAKLDPQARQVLENMQNMSPDMLSMMPVQAKQALQKSRSMLKAIKEVPPQNLALVKNNSALIEKTIQQMQE